MTKEQFRRACELDFEIAQLQDIQLFFITKNKSGVTTHLKPSLAIEFKGEVYPLPDIKDNSYLKAMKYDITFRLKQLEEEFGKL